jgi:Bacterial tandem repeat domain 1
MAGDIQIRERAVILPESPALQTPASIETTAKRRVVHIYGSRVMIMEDSADVGADMALAESMEPSAAVLASLSPEEKLGYAAYALRESGEYQSAKAARPHDGQSWDSSPEMQDACTAPDQHTQYAAQAMAMAGAPTSQRLTGSVAVGIIIVEGPNENLKFSAAERTKVVAEVQNGLGWLATQNPEGLVFKYDIKIVTLNVQPGPTTLTPAEKEARWRDPAMQQLGFATGMAGVSAYVEKIRTDLGTTWTYCGFFTKYPLGHFAYASIGGPRLVMHYDNDGWGPDNIDRVFAHETGHIFGAPDEYASSGCNCGGSWGFYAKPNSNCANCAPDGGVECLMKANTWGMCSHTPYHLGLPLVQQTYTGVWRQGNDAYYLWVNSSWNNFLAKWQQLAGQNLRLVDLKITRENGIERFHGVWRQGTGGYYLWVNASQADFIAKWQQLATQGLRLVDIEVQNINGTLLYSGVWLPGTDGYYLWLNADWNNFLAKWQELAGQNLRLIDLKIVNVGGQQRFFGVWRQGTGGYYLWVNADWTNFLAKWQQLAAQGLRLVDIEITQSAQGQRFSGVWLPGTDSYYLWAGADWQHFVNKWQEVSAQGMRLIDLEVVPGSGAQSPVPGSAATDFGGLAGMTTSDSEEDGMGEGGEAGPEGEIGYGTGSLTGQTASSDGQSGGLAGEGGGSFGGAAVLANDSKSNVHDNGFGGGVAPTPGPGLLASLAMEGYGGGSLR